MSVALREQIVVPPGASAEEAAAIAAALQRFLAQTAPPPARGDRASRWLATAREEALRDELPAGWGRATRRA
jgi:hypothetical protein